jgi:hypothetical protein
MLQYNIAGRPWQDCVEGPRVRRASVGDVSDAAPRAASTSAFMLGGREGAKRCAASPGSPQALSGQEPELRAVPGLQPERDVVKVVRALGMPRTLALKKNVGLARSTLRHGPRESRRQTFCLLLPSPRPVPS